LFLIITPPYCQEPNTFKEKISGLFSFVGSFALCLDYTLFFEKNLHSPEKVKENSPENRKMFKKSLIIYMTCC